MGLNKKGIFFITDAIFASMLLVAGLVLISQARFTEPNIQQMDFLGEDLLVAFDSISIKSIYEASPTSPVYGTDLWTFVINHTQNGNIENINNTIIEQVATFWSKDERELSTNLSKFAIEGLFGTDYGIEIVMIDITEGTEQLYINDTMPDFRARVTARRLISGYEKYRPITGSTGKAHLINIDNKHTHSYAYFGGFVGQGNVTLKIRDLPDDVNASNVTAIILKMEAEGVFELFINQLRCAEYTPTVGNFTIDIFDATNCSGFIEKGVNNFTLRFANMNRAYVAGGYIKMSYVTSEFQHGLEYGVGKYYFPEIRGLVNLYDGFYIPGNIEAMGLYISFYLNYTNENFTNPFFLTIGNRTIFNVTNSSTSPIRMNDSELRLRLDNYTFHLPWNISFSNNTIPIRLGFKNFTYLTEKFGSADVGLVTDITKTMAYKMNSTALSPPYPTCPGSEKCGAVRDCGDPNIYALDTAKLSVAKCLDILFAELILNITGNRISLTSFWTKLEDELNLTTNLSLAIAEIESYDNKSSEACFICDGIDGQTDLLMVGLVSDILIADRSFNWWYTNNSFSGPPTPQGGDEWYKPGYTPAGPLWHQGQASLGHGPGVNTEMGNSSTPPATVAVNLWEYNTSSPNGDSLGPPNDFSNLGGDINYSANTFDWTGDDDGWDWSAGAYDYGGPVDFNKALNGRLDLDFGTTGSEDNLCLDKDCSGAYGITVNITPEMYNMLSKPAGSALLSFDYGWEANGNPFNDQDHLWVKVRFIDPFGTGSWLGGDLDDGDKQEDNYNEIASCENPNSCFADFDTPYFFNLKDLINDSGPGLYYLHFGGKLLASKVEEWGHLYFDNISILISNQSDHYYFRRNFNTPADFEQDNFRGVLNLANDERAIVYLNGEEVYNGNEPGVGQYWDRRGLYIPAQYFKPGGNVIAVDLINSKGNALFDLQLRGVNTSRSASMLAMTDGNAQGPCPFNSIGLTSACIARETWGIQIFAVGYGNQTDTVTLKGIADCGEGMYMKSDDANEIMQFYEDVATSVISATRRSQIFEVSGSPPVSILYDTSFIQFNFTPVIEEPQGSEILVSFESKQLVNCTPTITIFDNLNVIDAQITSFSGAHWTDMLKIGGNVVYNLSLFSGNYSHLGDPFIIDIPSRFLGAGDHQLEFSIGDYPGHDVNCSANNTFIYSALINSSTSWSGIVENASGCNWTIEFEDGAIINVSVPEFYAGPNECEYTSASFAMTNWIQNDAYNLATYNLLDQLDFDDDGRVLLNLQQEDLDIVVTLAR
ncbi:MAG: hypothetical protein ABIE94_03485, partial [archaeon]